MTEPTDAEIIAVMRDGYNCRYNDEADHIDFAHAVLAKWGAQPVPASAAEFALQALVAAGHVSQELVNQAMALPGAPAQPVALELPAPWGHCVSGRIFIGRLPVHVRKMAKVEGQLIQPIYTEQQVRELVAAPQPVVREPLTDEQMYEERQAAGPQLLDLAKLWADNRIHVYQFVNEAEKIVTAVARRVEAAHGIKGGRHDL